MKIAYNIKLMRPGCVNIQAIFGGDSNLIRRFDASLWITEITDDMRLYDINDKQAEQLIAMTENNKC